MSGHSKWSTIKRQKGAADSKRGALFTKLGKTITVAAKEGGGDPDSNFKLRLAIDKAKASNMPKDNIERAIKRGTGELAGGVLETAVYEGFGPDQTAFIVEVLTDNKNRASSNIKHIFTKNGGNLGGPGSVAWMFDQRGVIKTNKVSEEQQLELIDAGAIDFINEDDGTYIHTEPTDLQKTKTAVEEIGLPIEHAEIEYIPKETKKVEGDAQEKVSKFFDLLDDDEDVNNVYTNADA